MLKFSQFFLYCSGVFPNTCLKIAHINQDVDRLPRAHQHCVLPGQVVIPRSVAGDHEEALAPTSASRKLSHPLISCNSLKMA